MGIAFALAVVTCIHAPGEPVRARLAAAPEVVAPGGQLRLTVALEIEPGWHVYSHDFEGIGNATRIEATLPEGFRLRGFEWPASHRSESFGIEADVHEGTLLVPATVDVDPGVAPGRHEIRVRASWQACAKVCIDGGAELATVVEVRAAAPLAAAPSQGDAVLAARAESAPRSYGQTLGIEASLSRSSLAPGDEAEVHLRLSFRKPGWHVYAPSSPKSIGIPLSIAADGFDLVGAIEGPAPHEMADPATGDPIQVYEEDVELRQRVRLRAKDGEEPSLTVSLMACDASSCLPPGRFVFAFPIAIAAAPPGAEPAGGVPAVAAAEAKLLKKPASPEYDRTLAVSMQLVPEALAPGQEGELRLGLSFLRFGWHVYAPGSPKDLGEPLSVAAEGLELLGGLEGFTTHEAEDPAGRGTVLLLEEDGTLRQRVRRPANASGAEARVTVTAMACDEDSCLPRGDWVFALALPDAGTAPAGGVDGGSAAGTTGQGARPVAPSNGGDGVAAATDSPSRDLRSLSWLEFLLAAAAGGLLSLLTPCAFPMVPITVSFFSKRSGGRRSRTLGLATVYGLGIVFTFTLIGVVVSALFGATGLNRFATNPWANLGLGAVFVVLGLSLLGLFQIAAPVGLVNRVEQAKSGARGDVSLVLLMSIAFTLATFTCTVPFVAGVLALAAQGEAWRSVVGMLAYSATFAAPFFLLALFPAFLQRMPRGGAWLEVVKVSMGFVEIAAALKFLSNADIAWDLQILTRSVFLVTWIALFGALALYLFGILRMIGAEGEVGAIRALFGVFAVASALYLVPGLFGARYGFLEGFLPPPGYGGSAGIASVGGSGGSERAPLVAWIRDVDEGFSIAREKNQRLLLDFTGFQ